MPLPAISTTLVCIFRVLFPHTKEISHLDACQSLEKVATLEDYIPLLSHLLNACPNLDSLRVDFNPLLQRNKEDLPLCFDVLAKFRDWVFPRLPQETKAAVTIELTIGVPRQEYQVGSGVGCAWL